MIGEFCPKAFALNICPVFRLKEAAVESGCRGVGRIVTAWEVSTLSTAQGGRQPSGEIACFLPHFLSLKSWLSEP
jgi:hypothetical protein